MFVCLLLFFFVCLFVCLFACLFGVVAYAHIFNVWFPKSPSLTAEALSFVSEPYLCPKIHSWDAVLKSCFSGGSRQTRALEIFLQKETETERCGDKKRRTEMCISFVNLLFFLTFIYLHSYQISMYLLPGHGINKCKLQSRRWVIKQEGMPDEEVCVLAEED